MAIFIDKNNKIYNYDIGSVNKCKNSKFLKRYEHYKKFFYDKLEERFARKQRNREGINKDIFDKNGLDLNKTM
jgi:hypothetical protein